MSCFLDRRRFLKITLIGSAAILTGAAEPATAGVKKEVRVMPYAAKDYSKLIGIEGSARHC